MNNNIDEKKLREVYTVNELSTVTGANPIE